MPRDYDALLDIRDSARRAMQYAAPHTRDSFFADLECRDAVMMRLAIIGEAAGRVPEAFRNVHPDIPWRQMTGMRNWLIHGYDAVDLDTVWRTVQNDLQPLVELIDRLLGPPLDREPGQ